MTKFQKSLLTTVIVVFAALTVAMLFVFGFGVPASAAAEEGAVSCVATVKVGENAAVEYGSIEEAWDAATDATSPATVKMYADATTTDTLAVGKGKDITLDLNGCMIKYDNANATSSVISVSNAELTLIDTNKNNTKKHTIVSPVTNEEIEIIGGLITGGTGNEDYSGKPAGGGVRVIGISGKFTMKGGTIGGNNAYVGGGVDVASSGTFVMTGGVIRDNRATSMGGGVQADAEFSMKGGTISGNKADTNGGGGVRVETSEGVFEMTDGEITDNTAPSGGGVVVGAYASFVMDGGKIRGNTADTDGGGMFVVGFSEFVMSGGEISDNTAAYGGGVRAEGTFEIKGGKITENTATDNSGGVYANTKYCAFKISGSPTIIGNKAGNADNNVYLYDNSIITVTGALVNTEDPAKKAQIGVNNTGVVFTDGYGANNKQGGKIISPSTYFISDVEGYAPTLDGEDVKLVECAATVTVGNDETVYSSIEAAFDAANAATSPATVKMYMGVTTTDTLTVNEDKDITLDLNACTLEYDNDNAHNTVITVLGTFTLKDGSVSQNGVITGGTGIGSDHTRGGGVIVDGGDFTMLSGTISGNTAEQGGGVNVNAHGTFTMTGGTICGNEALEGSAVGGGVCIASGAKFIMNGGTISGNTAADGGGVCVAYLGTFEMADGTISGNTASNGGGVFVDGGSNFTMSGGTIGGDTDDDKNTANVRGGGVFVDGGTFDMSGGKISRNATVRYSSTGGNGGGVFVDDGMFTMSDGEISGNTAKCYSSTGGNGGGVYVGGGTFEMSGGEISENTAECYSSTGGNGGGVYVNNGGMLTTSGGEISENAAKNNNGTGGNGGGVYVNNGGMFTMSGAPDITGNKKSRNGSNSVNNVQLWSGIKITVTDALVEGAKIGVSNIGEIATDYMQADAPSKFFIPDNTAYNCIYVSDEDYGTVAIGVHDYDDKPTVDKEPTCTEGGSQSVHCKNCDGRKDEEVIAALDHDFGEFTVDKEPTCTEEGSKSRHCSRCDEVADVTVIPMLSHTLTHNPETPATGDENGNKEYWSCDDCDKYFSDEEGKQEITDKSSVVIPRLKDNRPSASDDDSLLWIILVAVLGTVVLFEIAVIIYRAKRKNKAKEKD